MKHLIEALLTEAGESPPSRGARIETVLGKLGRTFRGSPPSRGARIETSPGWRYSVRPRVAPFTGGAD